jgi:hypothetical protein
MIDRDNHFGVIEVAPEERCRPASEFRRPSFRREVAPTEQGLRSLKE